MKQLGHKTSMASILILIVVLSSFLTGAAGAAEPVKIRFLQMEYDNNVGPDMVTFANQFMEENPDIQVEIVTLAWPQGHDTIQTWIEAKTVPDAGNIAARWIGEWYDALEPWVDYVSEPFLEETFPPSFLQTGAFKGQLYGLPYFMDDRVLYYRPDVFAEKGVKVPVTWDELWEAARALNDPDNNFSAFLVSGGESNGFAHQFENFLYATGGDFWDAEGNVTINNADGVATMELLCGMVTEGLSQPGAVSADEWTSDQAFMAGDAAMWSSGPWLFGMLDSEVPDLSYGMSPIPVLSQRGTGAMPDLVVLFKDSPNKEAAAKFTEYLFSPEVRKQWLLGRGSLPDTYATMADPAFSENTKWNIFINEMPYAHVEPQTADTGRLYEELTKAGQACMLGSKTAKQAMDDLAKVMEEELAKP